MKRTFKAYVPRVIALNTAVCSHSAFSMIIKTNSPYFPALRSPVGLSKAIKLCSQ